MVKKTARRQSSKRAMKTRRNRNRRQYGGTERSDVIRVLLEKQYSSPNIGSTVRILRNPKLTVDGMVDLGGMSDMVALYVGPAEEELQVMMRGPLKNSAKVEKRWVVKYGDESTPIRRPGPKVPVKCRKPPPASTPA